MAVSKGGALKSVHGVEPALRGRLSVCSERGAVLALAAVMLPVFLLLSALFLWQPVFTGKLLPFDASQQRDTKRLNAAGRLRIGSELLPGQYALQVIVTDMLATGANRTATQWIDFEIVN